MRSATGLTRALLVSPRGSYPHPGLICIVLAVMLGFLLMPGVSQGEEGGVDLTDLSIEDIMGVKVYGASKFEQKVTEAPGSVTIVTDDDIKKYGYRTLADLLRGVRGFHITYDRNYSYIGVRGFGRTGDYNSRFLVLIDGHRLNDNVYDEVLIGTEFILDIDLIKRVEIVRGPGFSLYGSNAFLGVINIITKGPEDFRGLQVSGEAGSLDTYKGRLTYGQTLRNGLEGVLSGSLYDSKGHRRLFFKEFDNPATNNGITQHTDYDRNYSLFSKLSYKDLTLEGAYISRTKGIPTASFDTDFNDPRNRTVDENGFIDLKYQHDFGYQTELIVRLSYNWYNYYGDYVSDGVINKDLLHGEWWRGEVQFAKTLFDRHRILLGAEYQINTKQDQKNFDEDPFALFLDDTRRSKRWAIYLQDEFRVLDNLILNAGVRHEEFYSSRQSTNPRVALIYNPFEKTWLKFIYGTAYRPPNAFELYYTDSLSMKGNPALKPEKITTYELIWEQYFGDRIRATVNGFSYRITDLIGQRIDPADGFLVFQNIDEVKAKGVEFELEGTWESGLKTRLNYTYQDARDGRTKEPLVNSPRHMAKLGVIVPLFKDKVFAGLEELYTSRRKTLAGNEADGFAATNLTLFTQRLVKGLEFSASVYNLFDKRYGDPGAAEHRMDIIEQDGRTFRVKLTYTF